MKGTLEKGLKDVFANNRCGYQRESITSFTANLGIEEHIYDNLDD